MPDTEKQVRMELLDVIDAADGEDLVNMWNSYAQRADRPVIYPLQDIEKVLMSDLNMSLLSIISAVDSDRFYDDDEFFTIDDMEYIVTFSDLYEVSCPLDVNELIGYIVETGDSLNNEAVRGVLDRFYAS